MLGVGDRRIALEWIEPQRYTASNFAREFGSVGTLIEGPEEDLWAIEDIGLRVATEIQEFFNSDENRSTIGDLRKTGVHPESPDADEMGTELDGFTFVFTGSVSEMTRGEAQESIERQGANATSSVSGNTDYLVAGGNPGQSKLGAAESEDVPALSEDEFEDRFTTT